MRYIVQIPELKHEGILFKQGDEIEADDTILINTHVALGHLRPADELELPAFLKRKSNAPPVRLRVKSH